MPIREFTLPQTSFLLLLGVVTLAFFWILLPFSGAVFWGIVLAIVFAPIHGRIAARLPGSDNLVAFATLALIAVMVILPVALIGASLTDQAVKLYASASTSEIDFEHWLAQAFSYLPSWAANWLDSNEAWITMTLDEQFAAGISQFGEMVARHAVDVGRHALNFIVSTGVMLYLLFFLFRDGRGITLRIQDAVPLSPGFKETLFTKFVIVIRATVRGNVLVAMAQGALGGLIFWFLDVPGPVLWGVVMAFLSLLPAVGAAIVWGPVAVYFMFSGAAWQGVLLAVYGVLVIGLVDNLLRPILVGKDTKLPDYLVLLSTIGGMALFGLNGFVIGPVVAAMFVAAWDLFARSGEFSQHRSS